MQDRSPGEWAQICRIQANLTSNRKARESLLAMAADYEAKAQLKDTLVEALFRDERPGTFMDGYVFAPGQDLTGLHEHADSGTWACDIADHDSLTWSDKVYELFGLRPGTPIDREWAVARYTQHSQAILERVRSYALRRNLGFILDALIEPAGGSRRWIRVLAVPTVDGRGAIGLHGVKRPL